MVNSTIKVYGNGEPLSDLLLQFSIPKDGSGNDCFMSGTSDTHSRCVMRLSEENAKALAFDILQQISERQQRKGH